MAAAENGYSGTLSVGPIASTCMMCPEAEHIVESRFLVAQADDREANQVRDELVIVYAATDGSDSMLFFREATSPATD